jgi:hypothetical protein
MNIDVSDGARDVGIFASVQRFDLSGLREVFQLPYGPGANFPAKASTSEAQLRKGRVCPSLYYNGRRLS